MFLSELLDDYVIYARAANRSAATITSMIYHVRRFEQFLSTRGFSASCDDITSGVIRQFIVTASETFAPKTVQNNVRALKALFNFGVREELIAHNPTIRIAVPAVAADDIDILEIADIERLLKACDLNRLTGIRDFAIVLLLFDSGMRASELCGLDNHDINWDRSLMTVFGKGRKARTVPVSGRTLRAIRRYQHRRNKVSFGDADALFLGSSGARLTSSGLLQLLERLGQRTNIRVHPHKLRHSFAVHSLRNGAREYDLQDCLGHTTLAMTKRYARQSADDLARQHKRFSPADRLKVRI